MESLHQELIAYIGNMMEPEHRKDCYLASKFFAAVHFQRKQHTIKFNVLNCQEKLNNLTRIYKFIKRIKPQLDVLGLMFINCEQFTPDVSLTQDMLLDIELKSCSDDFIKNCLETFSNARINYMFIGFRQESIIPVDLSAPKHLELYIFKQQFVILNKTLLNLICLTINMMDGQLLLLNLFNVAHVKKINVLTSTLDFNILYPEYITDLICYSSLAFVSNYKPLLRLKTFTVLSIPLDSVSNRNCPLLQMIENYVPKTANIQLYAEDSPHMLYICHQLNSKKINFELIYYNEESYINCRLIQGLIPNVKFVKFNSVFFNIFSAFQLSNTVKNMSNAELFEHMNYKQKLKWYHLTPITNFCQDK